MDVSFVVFVLVIVLTQAGMERWRMKKTSDPSALFDTSGFWLYVGGMILLAVMVIAADNIINEHKTYPLFAVAAGMLFGYRGIMEWRYIHEAKRHVVSFTICVLSLLMGVVIFLL